MKATLLAVRAIGAEFARKLWLNTLVTAVIIGTASLALLLWLVSLSSWWWLLAIPVSIFISVAMVVLVVFRLLVSHVRPAQTVEQKHQVSEFIKKIEAVQAFTGTPRFIILFRTVRSIAAPSSESYLQSVFETKNLKKDFSAIVKNFGGSSR